MNINSQTFKKKHILFFLKNISLFYTIDWFIYFNDMSTHVDFFMLWGRRNYLIVRI